MMGSLDWYVAQARRIPLLAPKEEEGLIERAQAGDLAARSSLLQSHLRLVVKIAHEYQRSGMDVLDLVQEGNCGLIEALSRYDLRRGVKFMSFASWWIRAYIMRFILNNWRLVKIGTTQVQRKLFFNLNKEREKLERQGQQAGLEEIAERLQVPLREVEQMQIRLGASETSIEAPGHEGQAPHDVLPAPGEAADVVLGEQQEHRFRWSCLRAAVARVAARQSKRNQQILELRLMQQKKLEEVARIVDLSRERVRQIEVLLLRQVRTEVQRELWRRQAHTLEGQPPSSSP